MHLVIFSDAFAVRHGLKSLLSKPPLSQLAEDERGTAEMVLAEALNNIVEHAYAAAPGLIEVTLSASLAGIVCQISDAGTGMPQDALPPGILPDALGAAADDLPEGGFGWFLIRTLTTDLCYLRDGVMNRLSFTLPGTVSAD